uniref:Uncharacterized protein n=1 Tax=Anopheles dirus TaxID=7168 RepID=A0A182NWH2_9DIPT
FGDNVVIRSIPRSSSSARLTCGWCCIQYLNQNISRRTNSLSFLFTKRCLHPPIRLRPSDDARLKVVQHTNMYLK